MFEKYFMKGHVMQNALEKRISELENRLAEEKKFASIGKITGAVAHELNNIFTGIGTYPEVLMMDENLGPEVIRGLEMIKDSGQSASAVVRDLLTICQGVRAEKSPVDMNAVLENYIRSHDFEKLKQHYNSVKIEVNKAPGQLYINGSPLHIEKIMMNLFLYAARELAHMHDGKISIKTAVKIVLESSACHRNEQMIPGEYVVLSVAFNSCSMDKKLIFDHKNTSQLFSPFFVKNTMGKTGTGLELTLVRSVVQNHNGYVHLECNENQTCFELLFPADRNP
ncbi:MAG: hypothetical protein KKH99_08900 [Proteobacteria bacterium]|nr:hypothetical protein [Pseudomonadota bacterium]